jgi:hypothetical protein
MGSPAARQLNNIIIKPGDQACWATALPTEPQGLIMVYFEVKNAEHSTSTNMLDILETVHFLDNFWHIIPGTPLFLTSAGLSSIFFGMIAFPFLIFPFAA